MGKKKVFVVTSFDDFIDMEYVDLVLAGSAKESREIVKDVRDYATIISAKTVKDNLRLARLMANRSDSAVKKVWNDTKTNISGAS